MIARAFGLHPHRDSLAYGIHCQGQHAPSAWSSHAPWISGKVRLYQGFLPERVLTNENVVFTFANGKRGSQRVELDVPGADDLVLVQAVADGVSLLALFPDAEALAKSEDAGSAGVERVAVASIFGAIDWSKVRGGLDLVIDLRLKRALLDRATPPEGFAVEDLCEIEVTAHVNLFGQWIKEWAPEWIRAHAPATADGAAP